MNTRDEVLREFGYCGWCEAGICSGDDNKTASHNMADEIVRLREQLALVKVALPDMKFAAWLLRHASTQKVNEHRSMADSASIITQHIERIEESFKKTER